MIWNPQKLMQAIAWALILYGHGFEAMATVAMAATLHPEQRQ